MRARACSQLLDLCLLDVESLAFSAGVLAAAVLQFAGLGADTPRVTGFSRAELRPCVAWMADYVRAVAGAPEPAPVTFSRRVRPACLAFFPLARYDGAAGSRSRRPPQIEYSELYAIQTHANPLELLVRAARRRPQGKQADPAAHPPCPQEVAQRRSTAMVLLAPGPLLRAGAA